MLRRCSATESRPSLEERAGVTAGRTYHAQSHRIQLLFGAISRREETSEFTFELLGIKSGFFLTLAYQPVGSSESLTYEVWMCLMSAVYVL